MALYIGVCLQLSLLLFARMSATNVRPRSGAHVPLDCERAQHTVGTMVNDAVICCSLDLNLDESRCAFAVAACGRAVTQNADTLLEPAQAA